MPNPWNKPPQCGVGVGGGGGSVSRLLSGLRSDRGGSLVVQTGFPTSLADLIVKNRGRLKKPSRKKQQAKKKLASDPVSAAPDPIAAAAVAPDPIATAVLPLLDGGPRPGAASFVDPVQAVECDSSSTFASTETKTRGFGVVFGLLLVITLAMVILAIERKKLVAGIVLSAFALWLLDSIGLRIGINNPCSDAKRRLNSVVGGWNLDGRGMVSPIREIGGDSCSDSVISESSSLESVDSDQAREVLFQRNYFVATGKDLLEHDIGSKGNSKAKKLFRKLVPKKFRVSKDAKDGEEDLIPELSERGVFARITEIEEEEEEATDADDDDNNADAALSSADALLINTSHKFIDHEKGDVGIIQKNVGVVKSRSSQQLVFCVVVLLGLLGGKSVALVLTLSGFLFHKSIKSLRKKDRDLAV
ncbi:hypothetical protein Cni_G24138 [Canna indica]|uniref:Transmembrane protein n=1 Tax=Canna indica TaxID=4628 RepID=A0AAQ3KUE5_9LILI|nr:hypothetical protein Cni_G24138 [Canna indica]